MGYGDAYYYAVILDRRAADEIEPLVSAFREGIDYCSTHDFNPVDDIETAEEKEWRARYNQYKSARAEYGSRMRADNIDLIHIGSDFCREAYDRLESASYTIFPVSWFAILYNDAMFYSAPKELGQHADKWMILAHSHADCDDSFVESFKRCGERDRKRYEVFGDSDVFCPDCTRYLGCGVAREIENESCGAKLKSCDSFTRDEEV